VTIKTLVTPNLEPYDGTNAVEETKVKKSNGDPYGPQAFWPMVPAANGTPTDFNFQIEAIDRDGQEINFATPLIFVSTTLSLDNSKKSDIDQIAKRHREATPESRHTFQLSGQKVAYAKFTGGNASDTAHEAQDMTLAGVAAQQGDSIPPGVARFFPRMVASKVRLQAAEQIAGGALAKNPTIAFHSTYLNAQANAAKVFASLIDDGEMFDDNPTVEPLDLILNADRSGGAITPSDGDHRALGGARADGGRPPERRPHRLRPAGLLRDAGDPSEDPRRDRPVGDHRAGPRVLGSRQGPQDALDAVSPTRSSRRSSGTRTPRGICSTSSGRAARARSR
jgi:hypothetical protein